MDVGESLAGDFNVKVIDPRWLLPVASDLVRASAGYDWVVTLEDGLVDGGFGSQLRNRLAESNVFTPVLSYGIPKQFLSHATRGEILEELGLTSEALVDSIRSRTGVLSVQKA